MAACTVHINCHSCILDLFVILVRNGSYRVFLRESYFESAELKLFFLFLFATFNFTFESPDGRCNHGSNSQKCWKSNQSFCCRTHRVPTYPWYSSSSSPSRSVSNYYYNCLIYHIQASGSPQPIHFLKAHYVSYPNTDENTSTKTKTMTKTKTPRE